jgi:FG-GAP-like repeat
MLNTSLAISIAFWTNPARIRWQGILRKVLRTSGLLAAGFMLVVTAGCTKWDPIFAKGVTNPGSDYQNTATASNTNGLADNPNRSVALKANPPGLSLASYTPTAAFFGNQMAIVGDATSTTNNPHGSILVRESNCGLTQYDISYGSSGLYGSASSLFATLPGVDSYLHRISGLTTTAGVFPKGCSNRTLGTPSAPYAHLGRANDGNFQAVYVDDRGKIITLKISTSAAVLSQTVLADSDAAATLAVADFNGDGIADIVSPFLTAGGSVGIGLFLSQANGSFTAATILGGFPAGVNRFSATASIEDVNGDGKLDIVAMGGSFTNTSSSTVVTTFLGNGNGGFTSASTSTLALSFSTFVLADFNGDGRVDLLTAQGAWAPGIGNGSFGTPIQRFANPQLTDGRNLAVGDFNGDGKLDVALRSGRITISIFLGQGDGSFVAGASYAAIRGAGFLNATDINGDGFTDIVIGLSGAGLFGADADTQTISQFLLGKGDGTFVAAQSLTGVAQNQLFLGGIPTFALADFNGDRYPDLVAATPGNGTALEFYAGSSSGRFGSASTIATLSFRPGFMASADTDGDGKADIIAAGTSLVVLSALGNATFAPPKTFALPSVTGNLSNLAVGDVNGDGRADVLAIMSAQNATSGGAFVYISNSDGTLKTPVQIDTAVNLRSVAIGDLNGDGRADIALGSSDPKFYASSSVLRGIRVYRSNADGTVSPPVTLNPDAQYPALAIGDLNKDGMSDLVVASQNSGLDDSIIVFPGQGDGTFAAPKILALAGGGPGVTSVAIGDFTFDGTPDLMLTGDFAQVLPGRGDGTFLDASVLSIASSSRFAMAADLNRDTMTDAIVVTADGLVPLLRVPTVVSNKAVVTPPANNEFALGLGTSSATVSSGQSVQTSLSISFGAAFTEAVTFSCAGLPANASCSFNPASIAPGAATIATTVTISTGTASAAFEGASGLRLSDSSDNAEGTRFAAGTGALLFGSLGAAAFGLRRRRARSVLLIQLVLALSFGLLAACGGGGGGGSAGSGTVVATPNGTYSVSITANGGGVSKSVNYTLTVQ